MKKCNRGVERTQERCYQETLKCTTHKEFREKYASCYEKAKETGWINDYTWLKRSRNLPGHWMIYENVYEEAKKYETKKEFKKSNIAAYRQACKNNWIKDYTWFKKLILSEESVYCVYKYYDVKTNSVYVGLTNNMKRRHRQHLKPQKGTNDTVYNFFNSINEIMPEPIILEEKLTAGEAQDREEKYVMLYKKQGMNVLNKAKTGSIGGLYIWDYDSCYQVARKYNSRTEFRKSGRPYQVASKEGWINDYTWLENCRNLPGYWTYEKCYNAARKYDIKKDFRLNEPHAYYAANKNNWIKDYTWLKNKSINQFV